MPDAGCGDGNQGRGNRGRRAVHLAFALSIDSPQWPRAVVTDKPFLSTFPCLADPLAHERAPAPPPTVDVSAALGSLRDISKFLRGVDHHDLQPGRDAHDRRGNSW